MYRWMWVNGVINRNWITIAKIICLYHKKDSNEIPAFEKYKKQLERWFFSSLVEVRQYNIPYKEIWFADVIEDDFNIRSLLLNWDKN